MVDVSVVPVSYLNLVAVKVWVLWWLRHSI